MTTMQALIEHQKAILDSKSRIKAIETAIEAQERVIDACAVDTSELDTLKTKHENLLADLATGNADPKEVDEVESEIEKLSLTIEERHNQSRKDVETATKALTGLKRKLAEEITRLSELKAESKPLLQSYFWTEIQRMGDTYIKKAEELSNLFTRLLATNNLARITAGESREIFPNPISGRGELLLPVPNLKEHHDKRLNRGVSILYDGLQAMTMAERLQDEIIAAMRGEGLDMSLWKE